jgi:hypothetical protein
MSFCFINYLFHSCEKKFDSLNKFTTRYKLDKNIERVQNKQQKMILKWNLIYDEL